MQAFGVVPVDPFQGFPFDLSHRLPRPEEVAHLGLEEANDAFGQGVVVAVPDATDRGVDPGLCQPLCVFDLQVLRSPI